MCVVLSKLKLGEQSPQWQIRFEYQFRGATSICLSHGNLTLHKKKTFQEQKIIGIVMLVTICFEIILLVL